MNLTPVLAVAGPFLRDIHHRQIQHFYQTIVRGKYGLRVCHFSQLAFEFLNRMSRINQVSHCLRILKVR